MGGLPQPFLRFDQEAFAGVGRTNRAFGSAGEQLCSEQNFQGADLMAERRSRNIEARGGAAEVHLLGDHCEISEVAQFHRTIMR